MFEEYAIGELANQKLREVLEKGVSPKLLENLQDKRYSKKNFGVNFSVLLKDEGNGKQARYYKDPLSINNKSFFLTSEWYPEVRPLLLRWLKEHGIPKITEEEINQPVVRNTQRNARNKNLEVWSPWPQPTEDESYELAKTITKYTYFLSPEVVRAITDDNEAKREHYKSLLLEAGIDPELYLWERSPCAFPGVKRTDGGDKECKKNDDALIIDANGNYYPVYIWRLFFRLHSFTRGEYNLAHLIDHKPYGRGI